MKHKMTIAAFAAATSMMLATFSPVSAQHMDNDDDAAAWSCPAFPGQGMMAPGMMGPRMMMNPGMMRMMQQGMMGPGMMGYGPMMGQGMMGPGMMQQGMMGQGRGGMRGGMMQIQPSLDLTTADVETMLNSHMAWRGVEDYAVGSVSRENDYVIAVEIVDADDEVVRRYEVNRQTGAVRPAREQ